ncbi:hypothetical protein FRC07_007737 [Ceratobasidium sp. 392]|nr:hypothetical protein FRC07_007737 [Ceratobasidium sp. 392]
MWRVPGGSPLPGSRKRVEKGKNDQLRVPRCGKENPHFSPQNITTQETWETFYKPEPKAVEAPAAPVSQFDYSSWMDRMMAADGDMESDKHDSPVDEFVYGKQIRDTSTKPHWLLNPITWWHGQCVLKNEYNSVTQMALDIFSTLATSVDVERAFSFVNAIVSKRRFRLSPCSTEVTASLGSYLRAGLVKPGILAQLCAEAKLKQAAAEKDANKAGPSKPSDANKSTSRVAK